MREKKWWWRFVPLAGRDRFSTTIGPYIFLTPRRYKDFHSPFPTASTLALVEHEKRHVAQWREEGVLFLLKYAFSRGARLKYEAEAYAVQILSLSKDRPNIEDVLVREKAKLLSSPHYLLFYPYDKVEMAIVDALRELA